METHMSNSYAIYTGIWTNWSYGKVFGSTLTLTRPDANLLIAFLAFYTTIILAHLWTISCFILHSCFSRKSPQDAIYHQRQAVLRNSAGLAATAWTLIRLSWLWRRSPRARRRLLPLLGFIALLLGAFATATGFSSRIATGNEVLIDGAKSHCGAPVVRSNNNNLTAGVLVPWLARVLTESAHYAQQCYPSNSSMSGSYCPISRFVQQQLPFAINANAPCPFDAGLCASPTSNLLLDTGLLDSHVHMGLNAPPAERFQFRNTLHCAPLVTEGHKREKNMSRGRVYTRYYYGSQIDLGDNDTIIRTRFTYEYPHDVWALMNGTTAGPPDYTLRAISTFVYNGSLSVASALDPIDGLWAEDADLTLVFLSTNGLSFAQPTEDNWYNSSHVSHTCMAMLPFASTPYPIWFAEEAASPMACKFREQYCFPGPGGETICTPLGSDLDTGTAVATLAPNEETLQRLAWLEGGPEPPHQLDFLINRLGVEALTSRYTEWPRGGQQGPLPDNQ